MAEFAPGSTDYVYAEITDGGEPAATVPSVIEFAFVPDGLKLDPDAVTWYTADPLDELVAQVRIGSFESGIELAAGTYDMYVRLTAGLIRPVLPSGEVVIE